MQVDVADALRATAQRIWGDPLGGVPGLDDATVLRLLPVRLEQLSDGLGEPVERIAAWGFVKAVLVQVWTVQDGGAPETRVLDVARALVPLLS